MALPRRKRGDVHLINATAVPDAEAIHLITLTQGFDTPVTTALKHVETCYDVTLPLAPCRGALATG